MTGKGLPRWPLRVRDVPPGGRHVRRDRLEPAEAAAFAARIGVTSVDSFLLALDIEPYRGDGLSVAGRVAAAVTQDCVVTLEPVQSRIEEAVEVTFRPRAALAARLIDDGDGPAIDAAAPADDPLEDGGIDLASIAAEFLALGVDPYPRRPGVRFEPPAAPDEASAFAALSKLKPRP